MKNKNKRVNLFFFSILLTAGFFGFMLLTQASDDQPIISAVQISGNNTNDDFIELFNPSCKDIDLSGWKLKKRTSSGSESFIGTLKNTLPAKGHYLWENISANLDDAPDYATKTYYLSTNYSLALFDNDEKQIDSISWGTANPFPDTLAFDTNPEKLQSLRRNTDNIFSLQSNYAPNNSTMTDTAGLADCAPSTPPVFSDQIRINELLPKPDPKNLAYPAEFVELFNPSDKSEKLDGWFLQDRVGKVCKLDGKTIAPADFLVLQNNAAEKCALALNDTSGEFLGLYNPSTTAPIYAVEYAGSAKEGLSYNFDSAGWRWSKFLTPGEENLFNNLPTISANKDNEIYVNTYAEFSANGTDADKDTLKYTWDFGDGHKSYLPKTRHKYEKTGKYTATLKVTDGSEDVLTTYAIDVIEFPKLKIRIVALSPNPDGKDTGAEYITLKNETKKKVNLKGWSIATGWKKMVNHPIREKFEIKKGKTKNLTAKHSSITLNNTKSKIELRNPAGVVIDKVKYENKKGVPENALYEKVKKKWQWNEKAVPITSEILSASTEPQAVAAAEIVPAVLPEIELQANLGKISADPRWQKKRQNQIILAAAHTKLDLPEPQGRVLGAATVRTDENFYTFTSPTPPEKHWALIFFDDAWTIFNILLNKFFNTIS